MTRCTFLLTLTCLLTLIGCGGPTQINIPPIDGDRFVSNDPNSTTATEVMGEAIRYSLEVEPINGPFVISLPEGTEAETAQEILAIVGGEATLSPADADSPEMPQVKVRQVRVRGSDATVDLVRPQRLGRNLNTVSLTYEFGHGWGGVDQRAWLIAPEDDPMPLSDPPPSEQKPRPVLPEPEAGDARELFEPDTPAR
jgi:hypothetical protein